VGQFWSNQRGLEIANEIHHELYLTKLSKLEPELAKLHNQDLLVHLSIPASKGYPEFSQGMPPRSKEELADFCRIRNTILKELSKEQKGA
jgi:hypothetical protein